MKIYLTTEFNITTLSFQVHPVKWNATLLGETDPKVSKNIPGYSVDDEGRDTWTVEICIDNGRIRNWPHGVDAEVDMFDREGVYLLEDDDGNSITYIGAPPRCLRILDDRNISFKISENGYIEDWDIGLELISEWGTAAKFSMD